MLRYALAASTWCAFCTIVVEVNLQFLSLDRLRGYKLKQFIPSHLNGMSSVKYIRSRLVVLSR